MAEKIVLAEFEFNSEAIIKDLQSTGAEIKFLSEINKELKKSGKETSEVYIKNQAQLKVLKKEYNDTSNGLSAFLDLEKKSAKDIDQSKRSIADVRQETAKLTKLRNVLKDTTGANSESVQKLNAKIDENTDFLKGNVSEMEQQKMNIGNYKEAITQALQETGLFSGEIQTVKEFSQNLSPVLGVIKEDYAGIRDSVKGAITQTKGMTAAQKTQAIATNLGSNALKLFRLALISTGIGAIVVLLGSLVAYLSTTQAGIDKVTSVTRPLQAVFSRLFGLLQNLGGKVFKQLSGSFDAIGEAIGNPKKALLDFVDFIKNNLINRVKSVVVILNGLKNFDLKEVGNGFIQATTGIENGIDKAGKVLEKGKKAMQSIKENSEEAWKIGKQIDSLTKEIENTENNLIVTRSELTKLIKEQNKIAEDTTRTQKEREEATKRSIEASKQLVKEEQKILDLQIQKKTLENSLNDTSREDQKELNELIAKRNEKETQGLELQTTQTNKLNTIRRETESKAKAQREKRIAELIKNNKLELDIFIANSNGKAKTLEAELKLAEDIHKKKLALLDEEVKYGKKSEKEAELERIKINEELLQKRTDATIKNAEKEIEKQKKIFEHELKTTNANEIEKLELKKQFIDKANELELQNLENLKSKKLISESDYLTQKRDLENAYEEQTLENEAQIEGQKKADLEQKRSEEDAKREEDNAREIENLELQDATKFELEREQANQRFEAEQIELKRKLDDNLISQQEYNHRLQIAEQKKTDAINEINYQENSAKRRQATQTLGQMSNLLGQETAAGKAAGIASATINTWQGVSEVWRAKSVLPEPFATGQKVVSTATVLASGLGAVRNIASVRAEKGITLKGPSHSQGGINLYDGAGRPVVEAEGDENVYILNKKASRVADMLSAVNVATGGVPLTTPTRFARQGGTVSGLDSLSASLSINNALGEMIKNAVYEGSKAGTEIGSENGSMRGSMTGAMEGTRGGLTDGLSEASLNSEIQNESSF